MKKTNDYEVDKLLNEFREQKPQENELEKKQSELIQNEFEITLIEEVTPNEDNNKSKKSNSNKNIPLHKKLGFRVSMCFTSFLVLLLTAFFGATTVVAYGPSDTARDLFVTSVLETSAAKFLAHMYFTQEEISEILDNNKVEEITEITNTDLIHIELENEISENVEPIIVEDVRGDTFRGKMMIISDPSRVFVGVSSDNLGVGRGIEVQEIVDRYDAVAGINAGGFSDQGGVGNGGTPMGIVITEGELVWGKKSSTYEIIGMDTDNKLVLGKMTGQEALDRNIRDAVNFGPFLIVNGEVLEVSGVGGGLNPRTAIGQRADGAILLLVCDGRQGNSLGATMPDLIDVMVEYGAVNAANLDGGSSTVMQYLGEQINVSATLYGPRDLPTAFIVAAE